MHDAIARPARAVPVPFPRRWLRLRQGRRGGVDGVLSPAVASRPSGCDVRAAAASLASSPRRDSVTPGHAGPAAGLAGPEGRNQRLASDCTAAGRKSQPRGIRSGMAALRARGRTQAARLGPWTPLRDFKFPETVVFDLSYIHSSRAEN